MVGKAIVAAVSLILVVGVVVGLVGGLSRVGQSINDFTDNHLSTGTKAIKTICEPTDYKEACMNTLSAVANNGTSDPKDLIKASISAITNEVQSAIDKSGDLLNTINNITQNHKEALDGCKEILQEAIDDLVESLSLVANNDLRTVNERVHDLNNWLSGMISLQTACIEGIPHPELKSAMEKGLSTASHLASNALAIVKEIGKILSVFNIPFLGNSSNSNSNSRRLLEADVNQVDSEGYPSWFSAADRKLMAAHGRRQLTPNAVVAKDGSGQYKTIAAALAAYPKNNKGRFVIYVKAGVYDEYITVTKEKVNVFMYGDGPRKTIVTGNKNYRAGVGTYLTASFSAVGNGFIAKEMGFRNTAGPIGEQAVALRVQSDMSAFFRCRMDGYQDTLYVQTYRQFYRNCVISGTVDFIFGDSNTVIQKSLIIVRKPLDGQKNMVTAHGKKESTETTSLVIQNCRIVPEQLLFPVRSKFPTYLGRPWKPFATTVFMESTLGDFIHPDGWMPWDPSNPAKDANTCFYAEYGNTGPGAKTDRRVRWKCAHVFTDRKDVARFTVAAPPMRGDLWLKATTVPFLPGFTH